MPHSLFNVGRRDWFRGAVFMTLALAAFSLLAPLAMADQTQVRAALDAMQSATLKGDKAAYLQVIDRTDPVFFKEQENWAADFDHHVPKEFTLTIKNDAGTFTENEAKFDMTTKWTMGEDVRGAPTRELTFSVVFKKAGDKWLYSGENWQILEAPGVDGAGGARVMYFPGNESRARVIADVLPEVRVHVDKGFQVSINRVQEVKIYKSMRHLQHSIYLSYVDSLGGWNEPGESIKILSQASREEDDAKVILAHEYGHVCTFEYGDKASSMPWWVLEGVAELAAEEYREGGVELVNSTVRSWAKRDRLAPWFDMADFRKTDRKWMGNVYTQGHHMLGYISEKFSKQSRIDWLKAMAKGKTIDEASMETLKMSFDELDKQWRASLVDK